MPRSGEVAAGVDRPLATACIRLVLVLSPGAPGRPCSRRGRLLRQNGVRGPPPCSAAAVPVLSAPQPRPPRAPPSPRPRVPALRDSATTAAAHLRSGVPQPAGAAAQPFGPPQCCRQLIRMPFVCSPPLPPFQTQARPQLALPRLVQLRASRHTSGRASFAAALRAPPPRACLRPVRLQRRHTPSRRRIAPAAFTVQLRTRSCTQRHAAPKQRRVRSFRLPAVLVQAAPKRRLVRLCARAGTRCAVIRASLRQRRLAPAWLSAVRPVWVSSDRQ